MIKADYHVHSYFSTDSQTSMEQMIEKAIQLGLQKICFTDHMDYDYPSNDGLEFSFVLNDYVEMLTRLKEKYHSKITILTGIELGLQPHLKERLTSLVQSYPFDFIIGSSHVVNHIDPYYPEYWKHNSVEEGIHAYFQSIINNCKAFDDFHVYGHLDYIIRYIPRKESEKPSYSYHDFSDVLDEALKTLIHHGKGIEINTAGYKYGLGYPNPNPDVIKRYKELGGDLITIGSDAHMPEHLCYDFDRAVDLLLTLGFRYYATYIQGKPIYEIL